MNTELSKNFDIKSEKDAAILITHLNHPTSSGRNPHLPKKSPYTVPAFAFLCVAFAGIIAALQVPQVQAIFSLVLP